LIWTSAAAARAEQLAAEAGRLAADAEATAR